LDGLTGTIGWSFAETGASVGVSTLMIAAHSGRPNRGGIALDIKRMHRFLRSLLVAGASLLIIVGGAFAGNALAPARDTTVVVQTGADEDTDVDEARDEDAPDVEIPEADEANEVDDVDKDEVDGPAGIPTAEDVAEDSDAKEDENDQGEANDANEADDVDTDDSEDEDADEDDGDDADEDHDDDGEHDDGDDEDSGEHDD
jgi:hypothetical protein